MALRWTPQELAEYEVRRGKPAAAPSEAGKVSSAPTVAKRRGVMNKLEAAFEREVLWPKKHIGVIDDWKYEAITLRLAEGARYTPDFPAWPTHGKQIMFEVKGHIREASLVRIKVAAELYPHYQFIMAFRKKGEWEYRYF